MIMGTPVALLLLRTYCIHLAVTLLLRLPMRDLPSHLQDQVITHLTTGTLRQTLPHPYQLLPIIRLQFSLNLQEKPFHSSERWQKSDVSSMHTTLSRFKHLKMTIPNGTSPTHGDGSGSTWQPSQQAAGVLLQWDHRPHSCWSKRLD